MLLRSFIFIPFTAIFLVCCDENGNLLDEPEIEKLLRSAIEEHLNSGEGKLISSNNGVSIYQIENTIVTCPPEPELCTYEQLDHSLHEIN